MECPICEKELMEVHIDGENYLVCKDCEGMWLYKEQLNTLLKEISGDAEMCSVDHKPHSDDHPPMECMACGNLMNKVNFLEFSDIIMDYCRECGSFWIDRGEISAMHRYIEKVEKGSHELSDFTAFNLLKKINEISYSIFSL